MMGMLWVVLFVALAGPQLGHGLPVRSTPPAYPHDSGPSVFEGWGPEGGAYVALPALALVITAVGLLFGCTWCYRHKDCKPNEGADNQLFTASATQLHDARRASPAAPADSGLSESANNNISEDNNNGPISLREMQNIANNNAAAYIVSENEERNRASRESVVEFEPLPAAIRVPDPLEHCADWFGGEDVPRNRLQYLREIARGWFGRVVETEMETDGATKTVAVNILNQNASLEDKARFLTEARAYRDIRHENVLAFVGRCLQEDPWILIFELCSMDLRQYLIANRPKMAVLNESGVPLRLMCDVSAGLAYLHSRGYYLVTGPICSDNVLVRESAGGGAESARAVLGSYAATPALHEFTAPETRRHPPAHTVSSEVWSLGTLIWEVCAWGASVPGHVPPPPPDLPCPYRTHLYQVMQLCWNHSVEARPTAAQVRALLEHLRATHELAARAGAGAPLGDAYASTDFEERWQRLKPNTIPKLDEHVAIVHAPSTSTASHFTGSDQEFDNLQTIQDTLSVDMDTGVSRSSSIMSDKDPLSVQIKSESLTNLHGSLEDVRNIYLTHNETAVLECHQGNIGLEDSRDGDPSDSSVDPWLKDIIAGSQDDVSYYRDVSDVIKNLDNILNSEKTSSSESSHQASPSRDNLSLDCKKEYPVQSSMVKSPGISNFQNVLEMGAEDSKEEEQGSGQEEEEIDRDTIGTLSHSFERHSDTTSQHTLENLTPDTPIKDFDVFYEVESQTKVYKTDLEDDIIVDNAKVSLQDTELPKENKIDCSDSIPKLKELCVASMSSVSETNEQLNVREDCESPCDRNLTEIKRTDSEEVKTKSIDDNTTDETTDHMPVREVDETFSVQNTEINEVFNKIEHEDRKSVEIVSPKFMNEATDSTAESNIPPVDENVFSSIQECETIQAKPHTNLEEEVLISETIEKEANVALLLGDFIVPTEIISYPPEHSINIASNEEKSEITDSTREEDGHISGEGRIELIIDCTKDLECEGENKMYEFLETIERDEGPLLVAPMQTPEPVQTNDIVKFIEGTLHKETKQTENILDNEERVTCPVPKLSPEKVQNIVTEEDFIVNKDSEDYEYEKKTIKSEGNSTLRSDTENVVCEQEQSTASTLYMDLINDTYSAIKDNAIDNHVVDVVNSLDKSHNENTFNNESTVYLDLPSVLQEAFLHSERLISSQYVEPKVQICASTPKGSDVSADNTLESSKKDKVEFSDTKVPDYSPGVSLTRLEQRCAPDSISPFESPTKSHHTDTYDENSSVVLGPFENCNIELFKGVKSTDLIDIPKEELLAFSSNFSEINLETPSPLRDGNFLNEVPDIVHDDLQFDDTTTSEAKPDINEPHTDNTEDTDQSGTAKRVSPSTPPNSPGYFLASTSQQAYLVDIDLNTPNVQSYPPIETDSGLSSLQKEIDLNQIELQITSKLAMAENENNMNIEYSGPLTVEGLVSEEGGILRESDAIPESILAGNGGSVEDLRALTVDEESMQALRNELELKLPLAQVAAIEPACDGATEHEWSELPPPPELVVSYCGVGALSPIAEETRHQLSAYENDAWNISTRTDSSESYPEPCNNSTDEVTDLPTGGAPSGSNDQATFPANSSEHSEHDTYTIQKDIPSSKEMTMSADSLNGSPYKKPDDAQSPIDDRTYNKNEDEKESNGERISQVSPFLVSPTTDTSVPVDSENMDNATGVSTLSKTTVPTDAKLSKLSECLSKATSIDSWCSNDTLYNVEENFDDLVVDPDVLLDFEHEKPDKSCSTETLTHNDDEKEQSNCSTYIVHDSKSDASETFTPDSITANDNHTYTKVKTEAAGTTEVKSNIDNNDSTKNTQTKDLAYGTLPSYSNCTTELISSMEDAWKLPQPELVRRSPIGDVVSMTPPKIPEKRKDHNDSPLTTEPCIRKMDSVDISFLQDNLYDSENKSEGSEDQGLLVVIDDSPKCNYNRNMTPSVTSTPLTEPVVNDDDVDKIRPMCEVPYKDSPEQINDIPNFQMFIQSAEIRPQDVSSNMTDQININQDTDLLLEGESKTFSKNSDGDGLHVSDRTPTYSDFEISAVTKPQEVLSRLKSSQSLESGMSSGDFRQFESSVRDRPQDLSSPIDASFLLLSSERKSSDLAMVSVESDQTSQSGSRNHNDFASVDISPPNVTNLKESHLVGNMNVTVNILSDFDLDEETDQPHSIIITEIPLDPPISLNKEFHNLSKIVTEVPNVSKESCNVTYDSHGDTKFNHTYDSHDNAYPTTEITNEHLNENTEQPNTNGLDDKEHVEEVKDVKSPTMEATEELIEVSQQKIVNNDNSTRNHRKDAPNGSLSEDVLKNDLVTEIKCNGNSENYAIVNFLNETFEELIESNVDGNDSKDDKNITNESTPNQEKHVITPVCVSEVESPVQNTTLTASENVMPQNDESPKEEGAVNSKVEEGKVTSATEDFLKNEKKFCQLDPYFPLLSDIRFTGPASEIMSTSFTQDSPTELTSPECEQDNKPDTVAEILKEWDSDSDSHSSNSSSGEFIWKQRGSGSAASGAEGGGAGEERAARGGASEGSGESGSGSGSEGDEVEFVPSSWDCRAAPAKSSLRSLEQAPPDNKKRVVFKRQKYHCVYEYPREAADADATSPAPAAYLPDLSTYCEWDPTSAEEAELGYGQLFGAPLDLYPLRAGITFASDFDEDFFISSSARPFESLGIMSTSSQFFPGMHVKPMLERDLSDDVTDEFPPPPSPLPPTTLVQTRTPSLDFTTPDSGVEDITPGSTSTDEDFKTKKLTESEVSHCWRPVDSGSSSESVSPSSPGGEALGGLRHTRDKLKLDLPPSPHIPSPRHNRVFNFVLDKPKRHRVPDEKPVETTGTTPLVMSDETPIISTSLPLLKDGEEVAAPEPTFSTFGKGLPKNADSEQKIILTDDVQDEKSEEVKEKVVESPVKAVEAVKGEGTVLDSGDEDSGIESSSKATLERNKTPNVS